MEQKVVKDQKPTETGEKFPPVKVKKTIELSEDAIKERELLSSLILQNTEELTAEAKLRKQKRDEEEFELISGRKISIKQINDFVTGSRQPYEAMFPNSIPFFKEMYRLLKWTDKNPDDYSKPAIVGKYINQIIYYRFHQDVQPALKALAMPDGFRSAKFFQYLTPEGQQHLVSYRDQAIELMKECTEWYEFEVKYGKKYNVPVQKKLFEGEVE
jgi:hypothetical protein